MTQSLFNNNAVALTPTLNDSYTILCGNVINSKLGKFNLVCFHCKPLLNFTQKNQTTELTDTRGRSERQVIGTQN